jgi:hypothetical protein
MMFTLTYWLAYKEKEKISKIVAPISDRDLSNFRLKLSFEKRNSIMFAGMYFLILGSFWYAFKKRQLIMSSLASSDVFSECSRQILKQYPHEKQIIFNKTSIGGLWDKSFNLQIQFSGKRVAGVGHFTGSIDNLSTKITEAILEVKANNKSEVIKLETEK